MLLDAPLGERKHFLERGAGRLVGYLEEIERALDCFYDRGYRLEFGKLEQRELADRLFAAAYATRAAELPPASTNAALEVFFDAIKDK